MSVLDTQGDSNRFIEPVRNRALRMGRLSGKDSRGEADGRAGGGLVPGLVMEDLAAAFRQDLDEAGEGGKPAHIEAIPDVP